MAAVHKKYEAAKEEESKKVASAKPNLSSGEPKEEQKPEESKKESVVVSDTVMETAERIEVIEEVTPESEEKTTIDPAARDPLADFKEKMNEEEYSTSDMPPKKDFMWPILFVVFLALAFLIGIFVYKQGMNKGTQVNVVTLTPTPTVMPQPTKTVDLTQYEIKVLNGSEVSGEAGRQKESLEAEGFTVSSIGNAAKSDYTKTIIQAKKEIESGFLDKLKSVIEESFVAGEIEELSEDEDSDVIIIIGSSKN